MINPKKKIIISFMGVDGAGKTFFAKKLHKIIKKSKYLHLKPYILFLDRRTVVKNPQYQNLSFFFISFFRLLSWLVSYKFFFIIMIKKRFIYLIDMSMIFSLILCDTNIAFPKILQKLF